MMTDQDLKKNKVILMLVTAVVIPKVKQYFNVNLDVGTAVDILVAIYVGAHFVGNWLDGRFPKINSASSNNTGK